jgi:hypothetical protein
MKLFHLLLICCLILNIFATDNDLNDTEDEEIDDTQQSSGIAAGDILQQNKNDDKPPANQYKAEQDQDSDSDTTITKKVDKNKNNVQNTIYDDNAADDDEDSEIEDEDNIDDMGSEDDVDLTAITTSATSIITQNNSKSRNAGSMESLKSKFLAIISKPGILAGIIGGIVIALLTAILLIMFIIYRMRKKDEGSYALEDTKKPLSSYEYRNVPTKEFYA